MRKLQSAHGGRDPGAVYNGRQEKDDTLKLTLAIGQILQNNGLDVEYTRTTDVYESPYEKAMEANKAGVNFFVSIHRNAFPVPGTASGAMTLVYEDAGVPAMLADNIQRNLVETGFRDLGVQERPGLIVLRKTQMPAVLVEAGFIDNPDDNRFFDENFDAIAQAIADGVLETIRQQEAQRPEYYQVQVGAFRTRMPADRLVNELQASGLPAFLVYDDGLYKVRVGAFLNMDYAVQMERNLRNMGYPTVLVRERAIY